MKNTQFPTTCAISRNELEFNLECTVEIYAYTNTQETNIDGVWCHFDPKKCVYDIKSIICFREQDESDIHKNWVATIPENTKMPTDWCMMEYIEKGKGIQVIPVVGTVDELTRKYNQAYKEYGEKLEKIYKNKDKLRQYFESL